MNLIQELETYIQGQRNVGLAAIIFGSIFILSSILLRQFGKSGLSEGMQMGSIVLGILLYVLGIGLTIHQNNLLKQKQVLYQENKVEFRQSETERMTKVKNGYPKNQLIMSTLVCISLLIFLFVANDYWQGISLTVAVYMLGSIIIEAYSHIAIIRYYSVLIQ